MDFGVVEREIIFTAIRSRGPGGQNVNKVSSAAQLEWDIDQSSAITFEQKELLRRRLAAHINREGRLYLRSDEYRDLPRNKERCLEKLRTLIERAFFVPKKRKKTRATRASKERKLQAKTRRGKAKKLRKKVEY